MKARSKRLPPEIRLSVHRPGLHPRVSSLARHAVRVGSNLPATTIPPFLSSSIEASSRARSPVNTILIYKRSQYIYIHIHVHTHICVYIINLDLDSSRHAAFNRRTSIVRVLYTWRRTWIDGIEIRSFPRSPSRGNRASIPSLLYRIHVCAITSGNERSTLVIYVTKNRVVSRVFRLGAITVHAMHGWKE